MKKSSIFKTSFRVLYKIILIMLVITLVQPSFFGIVSIASEEQDVNITISSNPNIDIVLSKARTKTVVTQFENDINSALANLGIDTSKVNVSAINAEQVNLETAFSWNSDIDTSIGTLSITNNGQDVEMTGNKTLLGKNAIWIEPTGNQEQKFTFNYNINFGDSFNAAGMLLRVKETDKVNHKLSGYMLSFNNPNSQSNFYTGSSNSKGAIWKFEYDGNNRANMTKTLVKTLTINASGTVTVSATDSEIKVSGGGLSSEVVCEIDSTYTTGNGFGFFSDHYSHNCDQIGSFKLSGINLTAVSTKSFKEVLQLPDWRSDAERFLINVDDYENEELKDQTAYSELLTKLMNESLYYISWGNEKNKVQFQNLIQSNNSKGLYLSNSDYNAAIQATAQYIKQVVDRLGNENSQYVVVNDPININVSPAGITTNTIDEDWPYGKWKIEHDHTYYENDMGQFAESGKMIDNLITTFDKTGKYEIYYKDKLVDPGAIYVHRKPIAQINLTREGNNITLTSNSYDIDELSKENKGISEEEWKWKTSDMTTWSTGKLSTIDPSKDYTVSLRVKDNQNTWSSYDTIYITSNEESSPIASFTVTNNIITKYENLEVTDGSYDPAGGELTTYNWEVLKGNTTIYTGSTPKLNYLSDGVGNYTIYLTVTNAKGKVSEKFGRLFEVTDDEIAPEVVITPTSCDWTKSQVVHLEFTDKGGSGFKNYKYAITDNQAVPTSWSSKIANASDDITITESGRKYLHIVSEDNAGNTSDDRITGIYNIDNEEPKIEVTGNLTTESLNSLELNIKAIDDLSGVKYLKVNNEVITNNKYVFTKNGTYSLEAEDNLGNKKTDTIEISNIYYECPNNLGHIHYSSSYQKCPICEMIEGLQVTNNSKVYNGNLQGVDYNNPKNAEIVEYYNSVKSKVKNVGNYNYDLKVVYNGVEYNTGITGSFEITKKALTITGLHGQERAYDTTDVVRIIGGELQGVVENDDVTPVIPETGIIENKEPGTWNVTIDNIGLSGAQANNYSLIQPAAGSIKGTIVKASSELVVDCDDKIYDGTPVAPYKVSGSNLSDVVYVYYNHNGELPIGISGDSVSEEDTVIPFEVGEYDVIAHQASDGKYEEATSQKITFKISPKEITIEDVKGTDKIYNASDIISITGGTLQGVVNGDDVTPVVPETGKSESKNVGTWKVSIEDITLNGESAKNYTLKQLEYGDITATISKKEIEIIGIEAENKVYDSTNIVKITGGELKGIEDGDDVTAIIPETGKSESKNAGTQKVSIDDIVLTGENSENYVLVQPKDGDITVQIAKKEITIGNIKGQERAYDTTYDVMVIGGTLNGVIENDDVKSVIPEYGEAENKEPGEWKVTIDEIKLEGEDAENYTLIQPKQEDILVKITKASAKLVIKCDNKVYDGKRVEAKKVSGSNLSDVEYTYYKHGEKQAIGKSIQQGGGVKALSVTEEKSTAPTDAGTYDVIAHQVSDGNYEEVTSETITFTIEPKEITIENINAENKEFDGNTIVNLQGGVLKGIVEGDDVNAVIPEIGTAENSAVGQWNVKIEEIKLTGAKASNYKLVQPAYGTIKVEIKDNTVAVIKLPYTGDNIYVYIAVLIVSASIAIILTYKKYKK